MSSDETIPYRADIDGLRAVSIVSVVLYHLGVPPFTGGFVGVDIFFVISGYLITSIVLSDLRRGTFSFARFYERRARRLLPTLAIVLLATFAAGLVILIPRDFAEFCKSMFYTQIFAANLFFADQGGYFDSALETAPLLHTWSLAVEEQFYLVWPLLCLAAFRYAPTRMRFGAVALLLVSFAANIVLVDRSPMATFYLPHTRFWELLAGCILALGVPSLGRGASEAAGVAGAALILFAVFAFDGRTVFPGYAAAVPVLGAALVIWSSQTAPSLVGAALRSPPLVFTGLISYAWYLWHWPMVALFRYETERAPAGVEIATIFIVSFLLAALCWKFVEQPVRRGSWWRLRLRTAGSALAASLLLMSLAGAGYMTGGFIERYPEAMQGLTRDRLAKRPQDARCQRVTARSIAAGDLCYIRQASNDAPGILLWGDSHANAMRSVFRDLAEAGNVSVVYVGDVACAPLIGAGRSRSGKRTDECAEINVAVGELLQKRKFSDVVLAARWDFYANGTAPGGNPAPAQRYLRDAQSTDATLKENRGVIERGLKPTIDAIVASGARAWVVMETPYVGFSPPKRIARAMMRGQSTTDALFGPTIAAHNERAAFMRQSLTGLAATVIDPAESLCATGRCLAADAGEPLYFDDNHLSIYGAARLAPLLKELFSDAQQRAVSGAP